MRTELQDACARVRACDPSPPLLVQRAAAAAKAAEAAAAAAAEAEAKAAAAVAEGEGEAEGEGADAAPAPAPAPSPPPPPPPPGPDPARLSEGVALAAQLGGEGLVLLELPPLSYRKLQVRGAGGDLGGTCVRVLGSSTQLRMCGRVGGRESCKAAPLSLLPISAHQRTNPNYRT